MDYSHFRFITESGERLCGKVIQVTELTDSVLFVVDLGEGKYFNAFLPRRKTERTTDKLRAPDIFERMNDEKMYLRTLYKPTR